MIPELAEGSPADSKIPPPPVLILHGKNDHLVPLWCSQQYLTTYPTTTSQLTIVEGENHRISRHPHHPILQTTLTTTQIKQNRHPKHRSGDFSLYPYINNPYTGITTRYKKQTNTINLQ